MKKNKNKKRGNQKDNWRKKKDKSKSNYLKIKRNKECWSNN